MEKEEILKRAPRVCGVYIMKDGFGEILYVGKARSLKKRISSYFQRPQSQKTINLISKVSNIDFIPTRSEHQALILETNLIKENQPKYNISYRDDKSFPWIKITHEEFPAVYVCRPRKKDRAIYPVRKGPIRKGGVRREKQIIWKGFKAPSKFSNGVYFGPYTNAKLLRSALKTIRRIFGFRSCRKLPKKACLYFRLKLCPAPCIGNISREKYRRLIKDICLFLEARHKELLDIYFKKMISLSKRKNFEEAAKIRDRIRALCAVIPLTSQIEGLKRILNLPKLPHRIEAFDVSSISGTEKAGSVVSFYMGEPDKENYRRFRIREVSGIDDYRCLEEILRRRYKRVIAEKLSLPDLIIIDGGKGHLFCAKKVLESLNLEIPVMGIAKEKEEIFITTQKKSINLPLNSEVLHLIQRIRNEAHRFAIKYHHLLRRKKTFGEEK